MQTELFANERIRQQSLKTYQEAYSMLNPAQRAAVDAIYGPVMVIAGPGTGKTQILAVRVARILQETDAQAHNILCLTFTDAATIAMRRRLVQIIGPAAHQVHIYTFHAFCNQVIQENLAIFGNYRQLEPITDLERVDLYQDLINALPNDHPLKRLKGDPTYEAKRLQNLFDMMKKENLSEAIMLQRIDEYLEDKKEYKPGDELFYHRKYKEYQKGDIKPKKWQELTQRMDELRAGVRLYDTYVQMMDERARYDYQDMILWVLRAFESDDELLASYQERYQFFLVDEFQDTNGAQKAILEQLISFWEESPNVFVVGDDDQAIYKFQGANMSNIYEMKRKYRPQMVVLEQNYRSSQRILDVAQDLIQFNQERILKDEPDLSKQLIGSNPAVMDLPDDPRIYSYHNVSHEQAALADYLTELHEQGTDLGEIAVIYRKHSQVEKLVSVLEKRGVPLNIKRRVDVLQLTLVRNILTLMTYLRNEYEKPNQSDDLLFEIMHYDFFGINSYDIAKVSMATSYKASGGKSRTFKEVISNRKLLIDLEISTIDEITMLSDLIDKWINDIKNVTLQVLFENILNEGRILQRILSSAEKTWHLQIVSTVFDLIKEEMAKDPTVGIHHFLDMIEKMRQNNLPLAINKIVHAESGVHFITAHSAKGLEYEKVIIPGVSKDVWDTNMRNFYQFKYPDNVNEDVETNIEDERRLFYVAITRARRELLISYPGARENGKILGSSQFIDEIVGATGLQVQPQTVSEDVVNDFQYHILMKQDREIQLIDHDRIDQVLQGYKLSVTGLNKYLKCPLTFYFESILQVPTARTKYMGFGRAVHKALEDYHLDVNKGKEVNAKTLLRHFHDAMVDHRSHFTADEYEKMTAYGEQILTAYHAEKLQNVHDVASYGLEIKIENAENGGVPIKGVLDKVEIHKDHVYVVDYKTGDGFKSTTKAKLKGPNPRDEQGGDYWRQIVFYKLLLDSDKKHGWTMTSGEMDFIEPDRKTGAFTSQKFVVSPDDIETVQGQIQEVWDKIHQHEFSKGCGDEHCHWCNFVDNEFIHLDRVEQDEDDIQES